MPEQLTVRRNQGKIWSHVRNRWLNETPEETVRQEYFTVLTNEYGYSIDQMDEEREVTGRGSGQAREDFVIWRSARDKADSRSPLIVVECKSDNVTISPEASRIAAKADGGEILVADTVRGLCSGKGFLFADRGEFVAKGFEDPVRVYEVSWREDRR